MGAWKKMLVHVAWSGVFISGFQGATLPVAAQQAAVPEKHEAAASDSKQSLIAKVEGQPVEDEGKGAELPDSPGSMVSKAAEDNATQPRWELASAAMQSGQSQPQSQSQSSSQPETVTQKPVGTAAAEAPNATGVAASQPAGVAIAPAKQRRVRTIVLRVGAIVGAGVAVGSVVALTAATSSKPPGAH